MKPISFLAPIFSALLFLALFSTSALAQAEQAETVYPAAFTTTGELKAVSFYLGFLSFIAADANYSFNLNFTPRDNVFNVEKSILRIVAEQDRSTTVLVYIDGKKCDNNITSGAFRGQYVFEFVCPVYDMGTYNLTVSSSLTLSNIYARFEVLYYNYPISNGDKVSNHNICVSNSTLVHTLTYKQCFDSICRNITKNETEQCNYGCNLDLNICNPDPLTQVLGIAAVAIIALFLMWLFILR